MAIYTFTGDFVEDLKNFPTPDIPKDAVRVAEPWNKGRGDLMTGEQNPFYGRKHTNTEKFASYGMLGKTHSEETKKKMSESNMGKPGTNNGKTFTRNDEHKKNISEATKKAMKGFDPSKLWKEVSCPHCNKHGKGPNMTRYHFDNCKTLYK